MVKGIETVRFSLVGLVSFNFKLGEIRLFCEVLCLATDGCFHIEERNSLHDNFLR